MISFVAILAKIHQYEIETSVTPALSAVEKGAVDTFILNKNGVFDTVSIDVSSAGLTLMKKTREITICVSSI